MCCTRLDGSVTARHCSSGRQPNFAALNRGRHLYSEGRPSRWALAHIVVPTAIPMLSGLTFSMAITFTSLDVAVTPEVNMAVQERGNTRVAMVFLHTDVANGEVN